MAVLNDDVDTLFRRFKAHQQMDQHRNVVSLLGPDFVQAGPMFPENTVSVVSIYGLYKPKTNAHLLLYSFGLSKKFCSAKLFGEVSRPHVDSLLLFYIHIKISSVVYTDEDWIRATLFPSVTRETCWDFPKAECPPLRCWFRRFESRHRLCFSPL